MRDARPCRDATAWRTRRTSRRRARCSPHGSLPDPPAATARRRQANGSAMPRRRPSPSPLPCNGWCAPHLCHSRARVGRARGIPGSAAARGLPRALPRGIPGSAAAARAKRYDSRRGGYSGESRAKRAGSGGLCHCNMQLPIMRAGLRMPRWERSAGRSPLFRERPIPFGHAERRRFFFAPSFIATDRDRGWNYIG